jgi:hypothetical protein
MKIAKHGHVIITEKAIRVEGWLMTPEPDDPTEASPNELVAAVATEWALKRLQGAVNEALLAGYIKANPSKPTGN